MSESIRVMVCDDSSAAPEVRQAASELADRLALPLREPAELDAEDLLLVMAPGGLELRSGARPHGRGFRVDLGARAIPRRGRARRGHSTSEQPLLRAIGRRSRTVLDLTAGFGGDAIALASFGYEVCAVERSPIVAELLRDGWRRALAEPQLREAAERMQIHCADSRHFLASLDEPPDALFIDPMFPHARRRSALPRLAIQLLRSLVGDDDDASELFALALGSGARRVVVKRSLDAPPLGSGRETCHAGKLVRYDVHIAHRSGRGA